MRARAPRARARLFTHVAFDALKRGDFGRAEDLIAKWRLEAEKTCSHCARETRAPEMHQSVEAVRLGWHGIPGKAFDLAPLARDNVARFT